MTTPDPNDEYLLYQTLVGAWPLETLSDEGHAQFVARIQQYMDGLRAKAKIVDRRKDLFKSQASAKAEAL